MITMRLKNIVKKFPGTIALNNVNFILKAGTIHGLVGKNGAGKTTLINVMSGRIQTDSGNIFLFENKNVIRIDPHKAIQLGIAVVPQEPEDIQYMTIAQNLFLGNWPANKWGFVKINELNQKARKICKNCKLDIDIAKNVSELNIAERQIISMIKAFYTQKNRIVILDEATAALDKYGREEVHRIVREAADTGISIVYISHELEEIFNICTDVTVLRDGVNIATKKIKETNIKEITHLIVGSK
jgi:ABC-type sugar transport system ATPase subunit